MKTNEKRTAICPKCGRVYHEPPAISREDGSTPICPDCGTREALASIGVSLEEQDEIVGAIHDFMKK